MKNRHFIFLSLISLLTLCSCGKKTYSYDQYKLEMSMQDNFKIMQLTDLHIAVQTELKGVKELINSYVQEAQPNLIVITGDTFMDATKSLVNETFTYLDSLNIPFAFTYGNHDLQGFYDRYYVGNRVKACKNALFIDYDDDSLYGMTNYYINLKVGEETKYRLFIVDSNSYSGASSIKFNYDNIHDDQLAHIENIVAHEGKVTSLAFFHIPFVEYDTAYQEYLDHKIEGSGENNEPVSSAKDPSTSFSRMKEAGVKGFFVGHDHINDTTLIYQDTILAYGVKSTYEIYNNDDMIGYKLITLDTSGNFGYGNVSTVLKGVK